MPTTPSKMRFASLACLLAVAAILSPSTPAWAKKRKPPANAADGNYVAALAVANRFLAAWQSNDQAAAMPLITNHAKQQSSEDDIEKLFGGPVNRAFEIPHGKALRAGRYRFAAVLLQTDDSGKTHRRFADFVVINTGKNDWAVDKLP